MPTVLVVDDDDDTRETLSLLFADEAYTVLTAPNGVRAVELLRRVTDSSVVLFDYLMPVADGVYILRSVLDDDELHRRHVYICMTARARSRLPDEFRALLDQLEIPWVGKPFDIEDILAVVADAHQRLTVRDETS